jgi:hypothetical protein
MEVLASVKEPYNRNTLWIHPNEDDFEIELFDKGWRVIFSTKDLGLSEVSKQ